MKKHIAIVAGGDSSEVVVSLKSAAGISTFLDQDKYTFKVVMISGSKWHIMDGDKEIPIDKNDFSYTENGEKHLFDCAYVTIHGTPGENGLLQGYFEMLGIPHTTCDVLPSSLTFDKFRCNQYLKGFGVKVAESVLIQKARIPEAEEVLTITGLPVFVKPNAGGSSFGVTKVTHKDQFIPAVEKALSESNLVVVEEFVEGTEVTNGLYKTAEKTVIFPVTEVVPKNDFFDFEAKYTSGMADEITPARISDELTTRIQKLSAAIYDLVDCRGIVRIDYIIKKNTIYLLEVNTTPGMTATSFIPQQINAKGIAIKEVFTDVIEDAIWRKKQP